MARKRRRSSFARDLAETGPSLPSLSPISKLSDELLLRILHHLPISALLRCQQVSHRFYDLAGDSQIWKDLYYGRFVRPRALRIPGARAAQSDGTSRFTAKRRKWNHSLPQVHLAAGIRKNWKSQYRLRHNWSIGACEVQEIRVSDRRSVPSTIVGLAEGMIFTVDIKDGLRAWGSKEKEPIATWDIDGAIAPTCLAVDTGGSRSDGLDITVGFEDGSWGIWHLDTAQKTFSEQYRHSNVGPEALDAVAFAHPYILAITGAQLLSLYTLDNSSSPVEADSTLSDTLGGGNQGETPTRPSTNPTNRPPNAGPSIQPQLLASLKSHTSWPPLSLSIRKTPSTIIASIAYSLPTYTSGYTVGLQELHLCPQTGTITFSRLATALPQGFSPTLPTALPTSPSRTTAKTSPRTAEPSPSPSPSLPPHHHQAGPSTPPTSLSYSHPYILAAHPDNTLTLYMCTSSVAALSITRGTTLWGHTSAVSAAEITPRGKAVSVSARGSEVRIWELEGGGSPRCTTTSSRRRRRRRREAPTPAPLMRAAETSVEVRAASREGRGQEGAGAEAGWDRVEDYDTRRQWVGFDDERVIVLKQSEAGPQALMIYDFT